MDIKTKLTKKATKALKQEYITYPMLGCDPEFFFKSKGGEVIGAERVLPKDGLLTSGGQKIIIDGVQAELNPKPDTCRENLSGNIRGCFISLQKTLKDGVTCDFGRTAEITSENLSMLDKASQVFGCSPSKSIYKDKTKLKIKKIDAKEYRVRAAGGHIHLGHQGNKDLERVLTKDYEKTVLMLDIIVGNTSVLVDRDEGNIERRKLYGRAGEFRLPKHGLEYRTLSNYWLTAVPLMSMAFGMARLAVSLMADKEHKEYFEAFTSKAKKVKVYKAINNNDFDLAMENFMNIESLITQVAEAGSGRTPINRHTIQEFHHFVKKVNEKGLQYFFEQDPMEHWVKADKHWKGFNDYLSSEVRMDMKKDKEVLIAKAA